MKNPAKNFSTSVANSSKVVNVQYYVFYCKMVSNILPICLQESCFWNLPATIGSGGPNFNDLWCTIAFTSVNNYCISWLLNYRVYLITKYVNGDMWPFYHTGIHVTLLPHCKIFKQAYCNSYDQIFWWQYSMLCSGCPTK